MKIKLKSIFTLVLLFTLPVGLQPADTRAEQTAEETETVRLVSCNGQPIVVPEERAILSVTIKNFIDDVGIEELVVGIPLGSKHCTLAVLETLFGNDGYVEKFRNNELTLEDLSGELMELIPILLAVNYLDIVIGEQPNQRTFLDTICAKIANTLTPEMLENEELAQALETTLNEIPNELQVEIATLLLASKDGQCTLGSALYKMVQHGGYVLSVAFSHDDKHIATASWDKTARVYDLKRPAEPILTVQHGSCVSCVAFSPCGRYIATASYDHTAHVYDLKSPAKPILTVQHGGSIRSVAFSPDGTYIATASGDKTARVYDLKRPAEPILTVEHGDLVKSVAFSPDGTYIATASDDNTARVYDLESPTEPILTVQHEDWVNSVAFSHDGTYIATASWDHTARVYDLKSPEKPILTVEHGGYVRSVAFSHDGTYIATASRDHTARVYDLKHLAERILTVQHGDEVLSVAFSHDDTYIATASWDKTARVYDLKRPAGPILTVQHGDEVLSVVFSHDGKYIATASKDDTAQIHLLPPNSAFKYLTILQPLFILLAEQKANAHQTIVPSKRMQQMWSLFNAEEKCFLMTKFGASSLQEISESMHHAATCIQKQQQENNRLSPLFSPLRLLALLGQIIGGDVDNPLEVMDNGFENIGLDTLEEYDN